MVKNINQLLGQKGSLMVEALAMLGLISMVTPVLYKKAAERTTELQDINTASQMRTISKAVDGYIKDNYNSLNGGDELQLADLEAYLPLGYTDQSKIFDSFKINVYKEGSGQTATYTGIVVGELPEDQSISTMRSSKIASMIGANGGIVDGNDIKGVQGGWEATTGDFGLGAVTSGSIAATSVHAVTSSGVNMDDVLYRNKIMGNDLYNTMATNLMMGSNASLLMGGNDIKQVHNIIANGDAVKVEGVLGVSQDLEVTGYANIGANLTAGANAIFKVVDAGVTSEKRLTVTAEGIGVTGDSTITSGGASLLVQGTGGPELAKLTAGGGIVSVDSTNAQLSAGTNGVFVNDTSAKMTSGIGEVFVNQDEARMTSGGGSVAVGKDDIKIFTGANTATDKSITIDKREGTSVQGLLMAQDGLDVFGAGVVISDTPLIPGEVDTSAGNIYVQKNAYIGGSIILRGDLEAKNITARGVLSGGGNGVDALNPNFIATNTDVTIANPSFNVGNGRINVEDRSTSFSGDNILNTAATEFKVDSPVIRLDASTGGEIIATSMNFSTDLANTIIDAADSIQLKSGEDMLLDTKKMVVSDKLRTDASAWNRKDTNDVTTEGVIIRRDGMITLPKGGTGSRSDLAEGNGEQNIPGYIKLDRIIGNEAYKYPITSGRPDPVTEAYDAYQVNPAYTSVMHDIKLTSRGGARLSDVLPDFINKGIYVIDNTYTEAGVKDWTSMSYEGTKTQPSCEDNLNCAASPWLGFVPAPQCPPGYAKVITINPIRWKMSEAYAVADDSVFQPGKSPNFRAGLQTPTDPFGADFRIDNTTADPGVEHNHAISGGIPLTFQTNTWLNTTISALEEDGTFRGWHAIMGFLYHGSDYSEYLSKIETGSLNGKIVWNLFPVYNQEVTAISTVYCYFERRDSKGYTWDKNLVDTEYDQMVNPNFGWDKPLNYRNRLNDPALKYNEVW